MDDFQLEVTIKKILEDKMEESAMDINVESKNGNIHLSGMVDVLSEKIYAEKLVKEIEGVKKIENNITIATDGYIPDSDIESYILSKFKTQEGLENISAKVKGGAVTLIGQVRTYDQEQKAIELSQKVRGVKSVTSNIKIASQGKYDDAQITSIINQTLISNNIDTKYINPIVKNNSVTLKGFVENRYEVELAEELVSKIEGIGKIKNHLRTIE